MWSGLADLVYLKDPRLCMPSVLRLSNPIGFVAPGEVTGVWPPFLGLLTAWYC